MSILQLHRAEVTLELPCPLIHVIRQQLAVHLRKRLVYPRLHVQIVLLELLLLFLRLRLLGELLPLGFTLGTSLALLLWFAVFGLRTGAETLNERLLEVVV